MGNNPYIQLLSNTWRFGAGKRPLFVLYYTFFIIGSGLIMLQPLLFALFLNTIQTGGPDMVRQMITYMLLYAALSLLQWCFHGPARLIEQQFALHVERQFVTYCYQVLMELPLRWHKNHHSGDTVSRIKKASSGLRRFVDEGFQNIEMMTRLLIALIALLIIHPLIGLVGVVGGVLCLGLIIGFDRRYIPQLHAYNNKEHSVQSLLFDYISNATTVLVLRLGQHSHKAIHKQFQKLIPLLKQQTTTNELKWFSISMAVAALEIGVILYYCLDHIGRGEVLLVGTLVALYQYLERFLSQFFNFTWQYGEIVNKHTDFRSIEAIWQDHDALPMHGAIQKAPNQWKTIGLDAISFSYEDQEHHLHTLRDISLTLHRGKRYAFVGESGSGKSTLLTLLRGVEDIQSGTIHVDTHSYSSTHILNQYTTLCPQDPEIFENTILYNITVGAHHTKEALQECINTARFQKVLDRLPKGLHTDIKEKGVNLSGGEKQRLALARGLFAARNSSLLLLDEPTSSVDPSNELAIYKGIFALYPKSTIVSSIHRLHLLHLFDEVFYFDQGQLIAQGSFDALLEKNDSFRGMWEQYERQTQVMD